MTTWTINTNKTASTWSTANAASSSWLLTDYIAGAGWQYNFAELQYNTPSVSEQIVYYNGLGPATVWTASTKN